MKKSRSASLLLALGIVYMTACTGIYENRTSASPQELSSKRFFLETGKVVSGRFLRYWEENGGLAQFGYPISGPLQERSLLDNKTYTVQYFERAVFELHPENQEPNDVLLSLLGSLSYKRKYPNGAPGQRASTANPLRFNETDKTIGGEFRSYWETHGGLRQQGYPISYEFQEKSSLDGKTYTVQYFERAVFELHPENKGTPYEVLLTQLGTIEYNDGNRAIGTASLGIPAPAAHRVQVSPHGSDRYLIWGEYSVSVDLIGNTFTPAFVPASSDVMGLELATGRSIVVADTECDQINSAISGSLAVWETVNPLNGPASSCGDRESGWDFDVAGKDLETGATYEIAMGPNNQRSPATDGKMVIWLESDDKYVKLLAKDLESNRVTEIRSRVRFPDPNITTAISPPQISGDYIVWSEANHIDASTNMQTVHIQVYDRQSATMRSVAQYQTLSPEVPGYALDGSHLVWYDGGLHILDLKTGETQKIDTSEVLDLTARDGYILWSAGPGTNGIDVYGVILKERKVAPLVTSKGDQRVPTIAGKWLVWENSDGPYDSRINSRLLTEAFASVLKP